MYKRNKMRSFRPPQKIDLTKLSIFLGGTIDMGNSRNWQEIVERKLIEYDINIYNPRRDDWDSSWKQDITDPNFYQQVKWELNALEKSDIIFFNFESGSKSPITLLEVGLYAKSDKTIIISCPKDYERNGNVEIVSDHYGINLFNSLDESLEFLLEVIESERNKR